jgi:polysaccharide export outer membrane protein
MVILLLALLFAPQAPAATDPSTYTVGPRDVLNITVFNQPQLTGKFVVDADGSFAYPLLGRVVAGGTRVPNLEARMRDGLAAGFLRDPHVTITVEQYRSQQVFVMGEVRTPGNLEFTGSMTLLEALARAGSTTERAGTQAVIIRRGGAPTDPAAGGGSAPAEASDGIRVNLEQLQAGALSQNLALRAGDTVFVPRAETVFVSGHVEKPGEYVFRTGLTVRQAIALAGGVTERGSTRRLQVVREVNGEQVKDGIDLQDVLRPGDTVIVRERFF